MEQRCMAPGFRFSPTDEELVVHYLMNYACGKEYPQGVIAEVDLYKHEPWELPGKSIMSNRDPVWYFFNSQDKKHHQSARINRTTSKGYWKATGKDRKIRCGAQTVGTKKTLIYYEGRAPSGKRTDWIMHEYKLDEELEKRSNTVCTAALCRVRKKGGPGPRNGEQFGAPTFYGDEGEDVEDNGDENFQNSTECGDEAQSSFQCENLKVSGKTTSLEEPEAVSCMRKISNDYVEDYKGIGMELPLEMQGDRDGADLDLYAFLESCFPDIPQTTSLGPQILSPIADEGFTGDYADILPDLQSLSHEREDKREEQILRDLMHLTGGGQCEAIDLDSVGGTVSLSNIDTVPDSVVLGSVAGDFIEINDMNSALDGFVLRSPVLGGYYGLDHYDELQQQPTISSGFESLGWSPDVLHAQGSAARRARLRIPIPMPHLITTHDDMPLQVEDGCDTLRQVQMGKEMNNISIQITRDVCVNGDEIAAESSSGSVSDSYTTIKSPKSPTVLFKHMSSYSIVKCEEEPSQLFYAAVGHTSREGSYPESSGPSFETSSGPHDLSRTDHAICAYDTSDCEAGESNDMMQSQVSASQDKETWKSRVTDLISKTKSLSLGPRLVDLEGKLRSGFDDKVCALGKPAAQILPAGSYSRLKTCVMTTLIRLAVAVLLLHLFLLAFHALIN